MEPWPRCTRRSRTRGGRPCLAAAAAISFVAVGWACATAPQGAQAPSDPPKVLVVEPAALQTAPPPPEALAILDRIQGYERWPNARRATTTFSEGHDRYVIAYYNGMVAAALRDRSLPFPDGAMLVAENRTSRDENEPPILTVMSKQEGRWYWLALSDSSVVLDDDGRPIAGFGDGASAPCASCHARQHDNDFVFHPRVTPPRR